MGVLIRATRQARGSAHQRRARGQAYPHLAHPGKEQALQPTPKEDGSIIIVVATDAPLTPDQCKRLARRAGLGLGRTGGLAF
ncbi:MAG: P1 family peptidase [Bilophila wadsworthia]